MITSGPAVAVDVEGRRVHLHMGALGKVAPRLRVAAPQFAFNLVSLTITKLVHRAQ